MRGARDAAWTTTPRSLDAVEGLGARTLALRPSLCRRLRRRLLDPLSHRDPLRWRNTTRGIRLFVGAAFAGLREGRPPAPDDRVVSALFCFGAIDESARLGGFSRFAQRRTELGFLRRVYGVGVLRARWLRRQLQAWEQTVRGRRAVREGRIALREWLRGIDPAPRLRELVEDMPADRITSHRRTRAPFLHRAPSTRTAARADRTG